MPMDIMTQPRVAMNIRPAKVRMVLLYIRGFLQASVFFSGRARMNRVHYKPIS